MMDYFALLNEARRPWIDPDSLKPKFLALSTDTHPDRFHTAPKLEQEAAHQQYDELNTAYNVLREPKERLQHLLELELGAKPNDLQRIPDATANLFFEVAQLCRQVDSFLTERVKITAPLLQVQWFARAQDWIEKLNELRSKIDLTFGEATAELRNLNDLWKSAPPVGSANRVSSLPLDRLEELYRLMSYLTRWRNQIQERIVHLAV